LPSADVEHRGIHHVGACAQPVDHDQQEKTAEPCAGGFHPEPAQLGRQFARLQALFLDSVVAATVDQPGDALNKGSFFRVLVHVIVEPHEQERVADPHNRSDDVDPTKYYTEPFLKGAIHKDT
jgi:hypothetical protein